MKQEPAQSLRVRVSSSLPVPIKGKKRMRSFRRARQAVRGYLAKKFKLDDASSRSAARGPGTRDSDGDVAILVYAGQDNVAAANVNDPIVNSIFLSSELLQHRDAVRVLGIQFNRPPKFLTASSTLPSVMYASPRLS
jgi:hypothetical protein